nr:CRISPR-associated endonuclease Cas1 [Thiolinea sp.]
RVFPASSLLVLAQEADNLERAWRHVLAGRDVPEELTDTESMVTDAFAPAAEVGEQSDDGMPDLQEQCPVGRLQTGLERLLWGQYAFPALRGYLIPKADGGVRPLAIPPLFDRILQRALQQVLTESLEPLMAEHSHGYRSGRSRITASQAVQSAWRAGFRWVYEGDVRDFFDSVDRERLEERLRAIFHNDPAVDALLGWMQAPVGFRGESIERPLGLPQGSPLSPVLANLMLDDFDSDMAAAGFRMIRYADDFVVLCKSPEDAAAARERARASLQEHGLDLHPDKSHVTAMEDGFRYLGYLFVNDLALDVGGQTGKPPGDGKPPPQSWLAKLGEREAQQAQNARSLAGLVERIARQERVQIGERERSGSFVTVSGDPAVLSTLGGQLQVYRRDECVLRLPWNSIESVLLLGNHQLTTQAMHQALERDIPVHLATAFGNYRGCLTHNRLSQHQATWMQQILAFQEADKALYCAKEVVAARLRHMKEVLRQRQLAGNLPVLDQAIRVLGRADSLAELLGHEGSATREYYAKLAEILPPDFNFSGRNRRPPRDPFNVMLSLGYTQLYALVESVLHAKGLLPWQGFYHQPHGRHAALASDLMEPFRHFVERSALRMVLRREIVAADFVQTAEGRCEMSKPAVRKYIALLLQGWEVKVTARGQAEPKSWLEHMQDQAQSLKDFVRRGEPFHAFRLR